jgi:hypothetical protein
VQWLAHLIDIDDHIGVLLGLSCGLLGWGRSFLWRCIWDSGHNSGRTFDLELGVAAELDIEELGAAAGHPGTVHSVRLILQGALELQKGSQGGKGGNVTVRSAWETTVKHK